MSITATAVFARNGDGGPVPLVPETPYQYANIEFPEHFTNSNASGNAVPDPFALNGVVFSDPLSEQAASLDLFSGSWVDATRGGEGWIIEVIDEDTAVIFWFTFDENGDQVWLIGVAEINGNSLFAEMLLASGPSFGNGFDQDEVSYQSWGTPNLFGPAFWVTPRFCLAALLGLMGPKLPSPPSLEKAAAALWRSAK